MLGPLSVARFKEDIMVEKSRFIAKTDIETGIRLSDEQNEL
jgi:hypothetical protein